MFNKKILGILFISLILFSSLTPVIAEDRNYSIEDYDIFLDILPNGLLHIDEAISYNFNGEFNGIYRDIPLKEGESIGNIEISLSNGVYGTYELLDTTFYSKFILILVKSSLNYGVMSGIKLQENFLPIYSSHQLLVLNTG